MRIDYQQQELFHPKLKKVLKWISDETTIELIITSIYRPSRPGTRSVHSTYPCRGTDLRCANDILGEEIEQAVNNNWIYDPMRSGIPVCLYHDTGLGKHLHIQVHPNTVRAQG